LTITLPAVAGAGTGYATPTQVAAWLGDTAPDDVARLILRASELIDAVTMGNIDSDDTAHLAAAQAACCAQVEYWVQNREETEFEGAVKSRGTGKTSVTYATDGNPSLAPRAHRALLMAGLLYCGAVTTCGLAETRFTL
jgi:hypothetical protein